MSSTSEKLSKWWNSTTDFPYEFLKKISINGETGLRGIKNIEIEFKYPVSVICGKNGCGKSTILSLAALAYHSPEGHRPYNSSTRNKNQECYYTFNDFFFRGPSDPDVTGVKIKWDFSKADPKEITKRTNKWMRYEGRYQRPVHFLGLSRIVPAIETSALKAYFSKSVKEENKQNWLSKAFQDRLSNILGNAYKDARSLTNRYDWSIRTCNTTRSSYSSFNMGTGEDVVIQILQVLDSSPKGSLICIEEIEAGIYPQALIKLAKHIQEIAIEKQLQIIITSHSEFFINALPPPARILLQKGDSQHEVIYLPTIQYAMGQISGRQEKELLVFVEDTFAEKMLSAHLPQEIKARIKICPIGSSSEFFKAAYYEIVLHQEKVQPLALIWDGDVSDSKILGWWKNEQDRFKNLKNFKLSKLKFPSSTPPEVLALSLLTSKEGKVAFKKESNIRSNSKVDDIFEQCFSIQNTDHHSIPFTIAQSLGESDSSSIICRSISRLEGNPLYLFEGKIERMLNGEVIDEIREKLELNGNI